MLPNLNPQHKLHLAAAAVIGGLSVASYLFTWSPIAEAEAARSRAEEGRAVADRDATEHRRAMTSARASVEALKAELASSQVRLEPVQAINQRVATITRLASKAGLQLETVQLSDAAAAAPVGEPGADSASWEARRVPIRVSGRGTYRRCVAMMVSLDEFCPDVNVRSFAIRGQPGDSEAGEVEARFDLDLVWHAAP